MTKFFTTLSYAETINFFLSTYVMHAYIYTRLRLLFRRIVSNGTNIGIYKNIIYVLEERTKMLILRIKIKYIYFLIILLLIVFLVLLIIIKNKKPIQTIKNIKNYNIYKTYIQTYIQMYYAF